MGLVEKAKSWLSGYTQPVKRKATFSAGLGARHQTNLEQKSQGLLGKVEQKKRKKKPLKNVYGEVVGEK